eukprot:1507885-Rhodomonas_salina.1
MLSTASMNERESWYSLRSPRTASVLGGAFRGRTQIAQRSPVVCDAGPSGVRAVVRVFAPLATVLTQAKRL